MGFAGDGPIDDQLLRSRGKGSVGNGHHQMQHPASNFGSGSRVQGSGFRVQGLILARRHGAADVFELEFDGRLQAGVHLSTPGRCI